VGVALVRPTVWAPVLGWWTLQVVLLVGACRGASYAPRPAWDARSAGEMMRYGLGYSAAIWIYQLRRAVNPLVVGRYLGAEAVGVVSLTFQLVVQLSFVAVSAWRLATAALARVQAERGRLLRAVEEGMRLQVPAVAPFLLLFAWLSPWLVPRLLGPEWRMIPELFPYVAAAFLFSAVFTMQSSALFVIRRNLEVGAAHLIQLVLLAAAGSALVPALGLRGWGLAEIATVAGFFYLHRAVAREVGAPRYGTTLWLAAACALAMFAPVLGALALVPLALATLLAQPWRDLVGAFQALRAAGVEAGSEMRA
jgi:PST family polysaccharide transporter